MIIIDNVIKNPETYVESVLQNAFVDIEDGENTFKGIQPRLEDELQKFVLRIFPNYNVVYNFIRQSPNGQKEPNYIHSDEMMGDKTVLLYLNKKHPSNAGTTLYNDDETKSCVAYMKYNRLVAFDSHHKHSRNLVENFGSGNDSRLVQVMFLKLQ
jgi:hypothetical protein